jgi:hypothetical protein
LSRAPSQPGRGERTPLLDAAIAGSDEVHCTVCTVYSAVQCTLQCRVQCSAQVVCLLLSLPSGPPGRAACCRPALVLGCCLALALVGLWLLQRSRQARGD